MPKNVRVKTIYPGVIFSEIVSRATGKKERIYYIRYRRDGRLIEERAGSSTRDQMTAAKANIIRNDRIEGREPSNRDRRRMKKEETEKPTIGRLWAMYQEYKGNYPSFYTDKANFEHIRGQLGKREPHEIAPLDIDRLKRKARKLRAGKEEEVLAPQTMKHVLGLLQRLIHFGERRGLCKGLGFAIERPRVTNIITEDLTPEQIKRLLKALDEEIDTQAANMMRMAILTGLRRGEIIKLRWQDIDFQRGFINIRDPKGKQDQRIPLNKATRALLEGHPRTESPFIFPGREGRQRSAPSVAARRIRKAAGLPPGFRPYHGLRHTYASMLASSGQVDLQILQKLLTHKSPAMSQRYAHLRDDALKRAADLAGSLIEQAVNGRRLAEEEQATSQGHAPPLSK